MKDFLEILFPLGGKKTITGRSLWNIKKNMVSTSQKISCPLERISSSFENCLPPNSKNCFHQQKSSSDHKVLFTLDRKSVSTSRIKNLLKNAFPLYGKVASTLKSLKIAENMEKNWCSLARIYFVFKN